MRMYGRQKKQNNIEGADSPTGDSSIAEWLEHPVGGRLVRAMLTDGGRSVETLNPVKRLAMNRLVRMSHGQFTQEMVDDLVRQVADADSVGGAPVNAVQSAQPTMARVDEKPTDSVGWVERIDHGRFFGKTIIVTGAGSGIGRATASRIAREGGRVIAVDVAEQRLNALVAETPDAVIVPVAVDITDEAGIATILSAGGDRIDGLANIAGVMDDMTPIGEVSDAVWERVFAINVVGTMRLTRAVLPAMLARGSGSIVNTASEAAFRGSAAGVAYTASKHAVVGLTKSTAFMYSPNGIRVNAVAPGPTVTNIEAQFASTLGADRVGSALSVMPDPVSSEALAASITFLLSDDGVNINGAVLASDGGWSAA